MVWVWSFLGFLLRWAWAAVVGAKARARAQSRDAHGPDAMLHGFHGREGRVKTSNPGALFSDCGVPQFAKSQFFRRLEVVLEDVAGHGPRAALAKADTLRSLPLCPPKIGR